MHLISRATSWLGAGLRSANAAVARLVPPAGAPPAVRSRESNLATARAIAAAYSADDRQAFLLLALPLAVMTFAVAASQIGRRAPAYDDFAKRQLPAAVEAPVAGAPSAAKARRLAASRIEPASPVEAAPGNVLAPPPAAAPAAEPPSERLATPAPAVEGLTPASPPSSPPALVAATPGIATPPPATAPALPAEPVETARAAPAPGVATPSPAAPAAEPAASLNVGGAAADRSVEVAALDAPVSEIPTVSLTAPPPATAVKDPPICVADENSNMKRRPVLGPAVAGNDPEAFGLALAAAAREQLDDFIIYTDKYYSISYPLGDIPALYGVCTDVVIRAYRAVGIDLQRLIQEARAGSGDTNIQHRRVDTQRKFFQRMGTSLPISEFAEDYKPGDVVSYYRPQNRHSRTHIAIVSDVTGPSGRPMIIHNRGWGPQIEDALFVDEITGHYRYGGPSTAPGPVLAGEPVLPDSQAPETKSTPIFKSNVATPRAQSRARTTQVR